MALDAEASLVCQLFILQAKISSAVVHFTKRNSSKPQHPENHWNNKHDIAGKPHIFKNSQVPATTKQVQLCTLNIALNGTGPFDGHITTTSGYSCATSSTRTTRSVGRRTHTRCLHKTPS
uniref:Uncharacterized protein n=1 Tax=Rhipicephalus zambeziensis TaxID=60191 RepID=A0A224Y7W6_9ACAR